MRLQQPLKILDLGSWIPAVSIETADVSIETAGIQDPRSKILRGYWKCILESYILDPSRFN